MGEPVQTIDLLPTLLTALDIPKPPRMRGRDLGPLLAGKRAEGHGLALAETDEQTLLAFSEERLEGLSRAYRLLVRSKLNTTQALERIEAELSGLPDVDDLVAFIKGSKRGFHK